MSSTSRPPRTSKKPRPSKAALPPPTPSEAAFERALAALCHPEQPPRSGGVVEGRRDEGSAADAFVDRAFANSETYRERYSNIGDSAGFNTKVAGVSFEGRQDTIEGLSVGRELELQRQPENDHDPNAIAVYYGILPLGYLNRAMAKQLAPLIDAGARYRTRITAITGGGGKHRGVNIWVERDSAATIAQRDRDLAGTRGVWEGDADRIRAALIGNAQPHAAQRAVLERIERGRNTLALLGTGRGKSFCFQFTAALRALSSGAKTLVVYPLRALANDQHEGLTRRLDPLGLRIYKANGSIENQEREDLFEALREGAWDVILATPEFLDFHRDAFCGVSSPALLVVDEAHHLHESRHRAAYVRLPATIEALGNPQVLALTATADEDAFRTIVDALRIDAWVIDPTIRENLAVVDARGLKDKIGYLTELFRDESQKGIVYCNSRRGVSEVAAALRKHLGNAVMFYHGGMPSADRRDVERYFREGDLRIVVATTAFGEGIDLPDVRHVVLYHLNFDFGEFNQQAGRAGRDGEAAQIHLLYGESDRPINDWLIDVDAPKLATLREIYKGMKGMARDGVVRSSNADIAADLDRRNVRDKTIAAALRIFSDSGLVSMGEDDDGRYVRFLTVGGRVEMERNERFAEGEATREDFDRFARVALADPASTLERIINRPIYPGRVDLLR
jgi:single-stranded-DNA-specific exonuclease